MTDLAPITGIDVSAWQPRIDWAKVVAAGHRFAYLKATEGERYVSPVYREQAAGAKAAGLLVGAYHFARPDADATDDADRFVDETAEIDLTPALDLEVADGLDPDHLARWAIQWLERVEKRASVWPIIYTGPNFWRWRLLPSYAALALLSWRLWQAQYAATLSPMRGAPAWRPLIWQWTGSGTCSGIEGEVDLNRFLGSEQDFAELQIRGRA